MSKKIILFLSKNPRPNVPLQEETYRCPDGQKVKGRLTNEAPLLYLMGHYKGIDEAICIVTPDAKETAWETVQTYVHQFYPQLIFTEIPMAEKEDFYQKPLQMILERIHEGDEIFLETTGGFRNAVMDLLLLSRILSYGGNKTVGAVYANYQRSSALQEIQDVTHLVRLFDLVGGMQELNTFGSVKTLEQYYNSSGMRANSDFQTLIGAMKKIRNQITFCNTQGLETLVAQFNRAMDALETSGEPIIRTLLPTFRKRFGQEMTIPNLIQWCTDCGLVQQALTIYREKIPGYLLDTPEIGLTLREDAPPVQSQKDYHDIEEETFNKGLEDLAVRAEMCSGLWRKDYGKQPYNADILMMEYLEEVIRESAYFNLGVSVDAFRDVIMDYYYVWALRNQVNHAVSSAKEGLRLQYICQRQKYQMIDQPDAKQIAVNLKKCVEHIEKMKRKQRRKNR